MKKLRFLSLLVLSLVIAAPHLGSVSLPASSSRGAAAGSAPEGFAHWTPAALAQQAHAAGPPADPHQANTQRLADFSNEYFLLAHREADGQAEWHENEADVFVVQSGSATLTVGGTMLDAQTVSPHEKRAKTIQGGTRQTLAAGDIVRIPPRTCHQLLLEGTKDFTYFVVKIKGY